MSVRILHGADNQSAVLYCSTTGWAFGPVFDGVEAADKAERFRDWFVEGRALRVAQELRITPMPGIGDGNDPREYDAGDLERLYRFWQCAYVDADGNLLDLLEPDDLPRLRAVH